MNASSDTFMRRAVDLSRHGFPAPNPRVGCVIVRDGVVVGEGYHDHAGGPHAEVVALDAAGEKARGADLYCTLEPCDHHGRTPPCTQAIIASEVARVFVAEEDPNPKAAGGTATLRAAGVECHLGLLRGEAERANETFLFAHRNGRPFVTVKVAVTTDGFIARPDGESKWITGERAREEAHRMRAEMGCVLVGANTVEIDDPLLTARVPGVVNQPVPVVLDPHARIGADKNVLQREGVLRFVAAGSATRKSDVELKTQEGMFETRAVLTELAKRGIIGVLVEGGGETIASFLRAGLVDRVERFVSRTAFGDGKYWLGANPPKFDLPLVGTAEFGDDLLETYGTSAGRQRS
ncbi:MAG TPA: bifunctional diaminohydroxyphosphoribosylaminopyrimidine deaminase/5-amino-6-(5-phosphoribosylamino)uracil reductase RibD [Fimbriimonadaceae bacterium]|nr:bifunctional diaminohydroxyphosphoribosylaminopyrimidine deaminase/5-amino-6-(5-phosphoribosylamino)uracil reductase RibD [Fimbriimonadaceae bacterium]